MSRLTLLLVLAALMIPAWLPADDLDDLGLDTPSPSPSPAATPAAASKAKDPDPIDELALPGDETKPAANCPAAGPATLPGGVKDAWNLVTAIAHDRRTRGDRPVDAPWRPWQASRLRHEVEGVLHGAPASDEPIARLVSARLDAALADETRKEKSEAESLAWELHVLDAPDSPGARRAAERLAAMAGDSKLAPRILALPARGTAYTPFLDRARLLAYGPAGADWMVRGLSSGSTEEVETALAYLRDAATTAETRELIGQLGRLPASVAAAAASAAGELCRAEILPDLEKASANAPSQLARAIGESLGRIRHRQETDQAFKDGSFGTFERRETASRQNEAGLILFRGKQFREAFLRFQSAADLDPTDPTYTYNAGSILARLGNPTEGVELMRRSIEMGGEEPRHYERVITAMRDLGQHKELVEFLEARSLRARYTAVVATIYWGLARERLAAGEVEKALDAVDSAMARAVPDRLLPALLSTRGEAHAAAGDVHKARIAFQQALAADGTFQRAQDGMLRVDDRLSTVASTTPERTLPRPEAVKSPGPIAIEDDPLKELDSIDTRPSPGPNPSASPSKDPDLDLDL